MYIHVSYDIVADLLCDILYRSWTYLQQMLKKCITSRKARVRQSSLQITSKSTLRTDDVRKYTNLIKIAT